MNSKPFNIFSWHQDFIEPLARFTLNMPNPARTIIVFPNARPARFLHKKTADLRPGPGIMPRCYSLQEFFARLQLYMPGPLLKPAGQLDSIMLLHQAVQSVFAEERGLTKKLNFPLDSLELFIPWGKRLNALMEDFISAEKTPSNLIYPETELEPFAALLLGGISEIYQRYLKLLEENELTTPAQTGARLARTCKTAENTQTSPFEFLAEADVVIAGFHLLSPPEEALFHYLWKQEGAEICLHTDPNLCSDPKKLHWAAREHEKWLHRWRADSIPAQNAEQPPRLRPNLKIYEGADLHSQIYELSSLIKTEQTEGTAVVLPKSELLLPTLHGLSDKPMNISMGYPLGRSPLASLLESALLLQENAIPSHEETPDSGLRYHWRDMLRLLHQPYLRMLGDVSALRRAIAGIEARIIEKHPYISLPELKSIAELAIHALLEEEENQFSLSPELAGESNSNSLKTCRELLEQAFNLLIGGWEQLNTLPELCSLLSELCDFLIKSGEKLWDRFLLDREYLFRLKRSTIPAMSETVMFAQNALLGKRPLFAILRTCLEGERVPFEASPLEGIQIIGMLESRLLSFKNLYILDAGEDSLPGLSADDPLLPDHLRRELGLPSLFEREKIVAHTFYRLIFSSENVNIFYQTGSGKVGLLDDKKIRSRFIEELIWEMEKERGKIIETNEPPLFSIKIQPGSLPKLSAPFIKRTAEINRAVAAWSANHISSSSLDIYLKCPLRFFYEVIAGLAPHDQTPEGDDPAAVGELVHKVLKEFFREYSGKTITGFDNAAVGRLRKLFSDRLKEDEISGTLPYDSLFMLSEAGPFRLEKYLEKISNDNSAIQVIALEIRFETSIVVNDRQYTLQGRADRIDKRDGEVLVLDYKTGNVGIPKPEFWDSANPLWERMRLWKPEDDEDPTILSDLQEELHSLQLPLYLFAFNNNLDFQATDAAFVSFSGAEKERYQERKLLDKQDESDKARIISKKIPDLIIFVLRHLEGSSTFAAHPGKNCSHCAWRAMCGQ
ncbi:MAG: PD-(D/E)XK nuclease family protein [Desulfovibrionaceae bacterium]|nr:PD-(D/E)XK nuclease family protein [Desulfovibrionaceae bacterium]